MSVNSKMTAIADEVRVLSGTTDIMGLDLMASHIGDANGNIDVESDLILQITDALNNKVGGTSLNFEVVGNPQPSNPKENTIWINTDIPIAEWRVGKTNPYEFAQKFSGFSITEGYINHYDNVVHDEEWNTTELIQIPDDAVSVTVPTMSIISASVSHRFLDSNGNTVSTVERDATNPTYAIPGGAKALQASMHATDPDYIVFHMNETDAGDVWIVSDDQSKNFEFNALKQNGIQICPVSAKQYVGGAWVDVNVQSYQNGEWVDWITYVYLYNSGDECVDITGGWTTKAIKWDSASESTAKAPTLSKNETNMVMGQSGSKYCGFVHTVNKINISGCKTICFKGIMYNDSGGTNAIYFARFVLLSKFGTYAGENHVARVNNNLSTETQTYCIDLSGVTVTEVYVAFQLYDKASHITVEKVWLEK